MKFRILGPLEVWDQGSETSVGGPKPRALLALLLLHLGEVVPTDRLIDELWARTHRSAPPPGCASTSRDFARRSRRTC